MSIHTHRSRSRRSDAPNISTKFDVSKYIIGTIAAMMVVVPLLCGSSFLTNVGKVFAFEVLGAVLISFLILTVRTEGIAQRIKENLQSGPNMLVLGVVACGVVTFLMNPMNKWLAVPELVRIIVCAAVYFGVAYNLRGRLTLLTDVILATSAAVALFGLAGVGDRDFSQGNGITGSFGTHEALGSFLMLMLPITASMAIFDRKDEKRRLAAQAISLIIVVCLAFSQSRSGWIGELVALGVLAALATRFYTTKNAAPRQKLIAVLPFAAFLAIGVFIVAVSGSGMDVQQRLGTLGSGSTDLSMHQRLQLWHAALVMIAAKPIFGWGLGSFPYIASRFTTVALPAGFVASNGANLTNIAHNYYLQTAAETGLVGLGLYAAMLVTFFVVGLRALKGMKDGGRKVVLIGVLAAMSGQVIDAITSPSYNIASISLFQWLLMGIGMFAAGVPVQAEETEEEPVRNEVSLGKNLRRGLAGLAAATVCLSSIGLFVATAGTAVADSYNRHGICDTDAWLIGIGAGGAGYFIGASLAHGDGHHNHGGGSNNGGGPGNGNGQGNGSGASPTSYQDNSQINDRVNAQVNSQVNSQLQTQ